MDILLLKQRVSSLVQFSHFRDGALWYKCADDFEFPVKIDETTNSQGSSATFLRDDKGIVFMRWIRKEMEAELEFEAMIAQAKKELE